MMIMTTMTMIMMTTRAMKWKMELSMPENTIRNPAGHETRGENRIKMRSLPDGKISMNGIQSVNHTRRLFHLLQARKKLRIKILTRIWNERNDLLKKSTCKQQGLLTDIATGTGTDKQCKMMFRVL